MTRRMTAAVVVVAVAGAAVPALAALLTPRQATPPPQLSINTAVPAFTIIGLVPGDAMTRCLRVRNEGEEPIVLRDGAAVTGDLAPYLRLSIERGTGLGDVGPSCAGFTSSGAYAYGTNAAGVPASALEVETNNSWAAHEEKSLRITVSLPSDAPNAAMAKQGTVTFAFAGFPPSTETTPTTPTTTTPDLPGGIAPGTDGGTDIDGNFIPNKEIKTRLKIGTARLLKDGNVRVTMWLPAGGAIRAKVILPNGVYYAHTLLPEEWGPKLVVVLKRRAVGRAAVRKARRKHRRLVVRVTTRYRWAHGDDAYVQPEQKLVIVRGRRR